MSHADLMLLQAGAAFAPATRHDQLGELHVPFDQLTGRDDCEGRLEQALRQRQRVALIGASGAGKSSVTAHVLGPLVEGLAPIPVPIALERPEISTDPVAFAAHLTGLIRQWIHDARPRLEGPAQRLRPGKPRGGKTHKVSIAPQWLGAKLELAYELGVRSQEVPTTGQQTISQARELLELVDEDDLVPVIVLDDTDRWLDNHWQPDNPLVRAGFFGRIVRMLAEEFGTAAVVAVHRTYLADPAYRDNAAFLTPEIYIPAVPSPAGVGQILQRRVDLVSEHDGAVANVLTMDALEVVYEHYAEEPNVRTRLLRVVSEALPLAIDDGADMIGRAHCVAAITQNAPGAT